MTLLIRLQFFLWLNWYEMTKTDYKAFRVYGNYPKNSLSWEFSIPIYNMVSYDFLLLMLKN